MTPTSKKAMFKTALTIGIIAIILAIATVWPPIFGYVALLFFVSVFVGVIYMLFYMYEDTKTWKKP